MEAPEKTKDRPPKRIFLQYYGLDADEMNLEYGDEWCEAHETSYCVDKIYDTDAEYIRSDLCTMPEELVLLLRRAHSLLNHNFPSNDKTILQSEIRDILAWHEGRE